jgi:hypothetical protein
MANETWRNPSDMPIWVQVTEGRTGQMRHREVPVKGGTIVISEEDRRHNQAQVYFNPAVDVFTNGSLIPVRLIDSSEDYEELATNPNFLSDEDIRDSLKGPVKKLRESLEEVSNLQVVSRYAAAAEELEVTKAKQDAIEARLEALTPKESRDLNDGASTVKDGEDAYTFMDMSV